MPRSRPRAILPMPRQAGQPRPSGPATVKVGKPTPPPKVSGSPETANELGIISFRRAVAAMEELVKAARKGRPTKRDVKAILTLADGAAQWSLEHSPDGRLIIGPPRRLLGADAIRKSRDLDALVAQFEDLRRYTEAVGHAVQFEAAFDEADQLVARINKLAGKRLLEKLP
jgi:hypothetical protein